MGRSCGVPESVLGSGFGAAVGERAVLAAVFISNVPEGLSSAEVKRSGPLGGYVFGVWAASR